VSGAQPRRVLLVYARVGGGHLSAARALAEEFEAHGSQTRLVDAYLECGQFPLTLFPKAYAELARHHPRLWSVLYRGSNRLDPKLVLGPFLRAGLRQVAREEQPDVIVSVLPVVNGLLAEVGRTEVVLTDWHAVHRSWVAGGVAHYTAPTESAASDCVLYGAPPGAVDVVGIPVRSMFASPAPRTTRERFTVLVMVGAEGSPRAIDNVRALLGLEIDVQVVCGRNVQLLNQVQALTGRARLQAFGFVENVAELMRSCDVLVTKAGGLTLAEAFACGAPVVVYDVLPGQEAGNLAYALAHQAVLHSHSPPELALHVAALRDDADKRAQLAKNGARLARPYAAEEIVSAVLRRLDAARA
jgi:processive 1,2-diacylglycerol beta-glucosyltransferase